MTRRRKGKKASTAQTTPAPAAPGRDVPLPLVSRFQVAECLGAGPTSVSRWEREGLPVAARGAGGRPSKYSLPDVIRWYVAHERARYEQHADAQNLDAERARLAKVQARKAELDVRQREGELVTVGEVAAVVTEILATVRARLLAMPGALAAPLEAAGREGGPRAVEAILRDRITGALRELAAWRPPPAPEAPA
jgi:phage terminase Nu1 subunit (DNA packaging protein)